MTKVQCNPLEYYIHDGPTALRFELTGSLSGRGAESIKCAWQTALSIIGDRTVVVDVSSVTEADERGQELLRLWRQSGVQIVAG